MISDFKRVHFCYTDKYSDLCDKKAMKYFHVYTKGLEDRQLFRDREDYITGMNILAVVCSMYPQLKLLAFVLMSNHVHFVLLGTEEGAKKFIDMYKSTLSRYLHSKYGVTKYLRHLTTTVSEVSLENDGIKRLIAYVLNNPVKAGINCVASGYEWSSARYYYNQLDLLADAVSVGTMSIRQQRKLFHSCHKIPENWYMTSSGYVSPLCYVDYSSVERIYGKGRSFQYFLSTSLSLRKGVAENITFSDSMLHSAIKELLDKKYSVESISDLDEFLKRNMIKDLKHRFSSSSKQLARVTGMTVSEIVRLLE